jgi:hypothetical protein
MLRCFVRNTDRKTDESKRNKKVKSSFKYGQLQCYIQQDIRKAFGHFDTLLLTFGF